MKVTSEKVPDSQVELNVELEPAEIELYSEKAYKRLVKKVNIPGFRKGKTPRSVLEQYVGRGAFLDDIMNNDLSAIYGKAIEEQKIDAIDQPQIEITQIDPITFKATIPVRPTVKLGDYKNVRIEADVAEITQEQITGVIDQLRNAQAAWEPVDRDTKWDDMLTVDVEASHEGTSLGKEEGRQYQILPESQAPAPGFAEQLVEQKKGDKKNFSLSVPEDFGNQLFAGKEITFDVAISEIKEKHLPELNDDFAKVVGSDSVDKLKENIQEDLKTRAVDQSRMQHEENIVNAIVEQATIEYPPVMKDREVEMMLDEQRNQLAQAQVNLDDYLKHVNKTVDDLKAEMEPMAIRKVKGSLVLSQVSEDEKIEVVDEELTAELEKMIPADENEAKRFREAFENPVARASVMRSLRTKKTLERLVEIATSKAVKVPAKKKSPAKAKKEVKDAAE
ncbi:MAG: trigger factor [Chloroflexi bacterium]|nr:trigger factor [Chloroflexota bacterium]MBT7080710.1 trigger factor [Chloroflexota bacterium]